MAGKRTALRISLLAVSAAIVAVFTLIIRIPSPIGGYISLCDAAVSFVAYAFGPFTGLISSALGASMADLIGGYPQWAVISAIVHGVEALVLGLIIKKSSSILSMLLSIVVTIVIVAGGYLLLTTLFGLATFSEAVAEVVGM